MGWLGCKLSVLYHSQIRRDVYQRKQVFKISPISDTTDTTLASLEDRVLELQQQLLNYRFTTLLFF